MPRQQRVVRAGLVCGLRAWEIPFGGQSPHARKSSVRQGQFCREAGELSGRLTPSGFKSCRLARERPQGEGSLGVLLFQQRTGFVDHRRGDFCCKRDEWITHRLAGDQMA